jgi:hypothetical protein|tara:strand:+ start:218 stop:334 length:117 start_codon:yes stop_codon:yes gene_type:complete
MGKILYWEKMIPGVYAYTIDYTKNGALEIKIGSGTLVR